MKEKERFMADENIVRARFVGGVMYQEHPDGTLTPLPPGQTDWAAIDAKSEDQLLAEALSDPDALPMSDVELANAERVLLKAPVSIRLDEEVLDYFRASGRGYQTRINAVLRTYVRAQKARRKRPRDLFVSTKNAFEYRIYMFEVIGEIKKFINFGGC